MAKFKKVDDLIGSFLDFDILEDETPVATTDEDGKTVVMTQKEYADFLEKKAARETDDAPNSTPNTAPNDTPDAAANNAPNTAANDVADETPDDTPNAAANDAPNDAPDE
ncbi:MAG: hypothetical protein LBL66_04095 [Clostridiales bacterium]|jgi:hypothetical protein|nr:hypothetical protein [Clostridiales bacterium]